MDAGAMAAAVGGGTTLSNTSRRKRASQTAASGLGVEGCLRPTGLKKMNRVIENSALRPAAAVTIGKRFAIPFSQQTDIQL